MFSGTKEWKESEREIKNRKISRKAAAEGMVLLKNDNHVLPLKKGSRIALYGSGAEKTVKGGIGSGDVNERETVSIAEGLKRKGFQLSTEEWLSEYNQIYERARECWREYLLQQSNSGELEDFFYTYVAHPFQIPDTQGIKLKDVELMETNTAIYVISRKSGEAADRYAEKGDYYLTEQEEKDIENICIAYKHVILILNTGGVIDLSIVDQYPMIEGILFISQAGMEGGNAVADIIAGDICPSGKLVDTWAKEYEDYPNSEIFSHNNGNVEKEFYEEGIYVGYRYFDTFRVTPRYAFGYGLTYAEMSIKADDISISCDHEGIISVETIVQNRDNVFCGKEVVQVYVSCPQTNLQKERRRLCGFAKSPLLNPAESVKLNIQFSRREMASFCEEKNAWILEKGIYGVWIGNSSDHLKLCGGIVVDEEVCVEKVEKICQLKEDLKELRQEELSIVSEKIFSEVPLIHMNAVNGQEKAGSVRKINTESAEVKKYIEQMKTDELVRIVVGEISRAQGNQESVIGNAGTMIPGTAGETSEVLKNRFGIASAIMADGPAGLRIKKQYAVDKATQQIIPDSPFAAFEGGYFAQEVISENSEIYYQFCTSFPVGTLLAQSWNLDLVREVGAAVGTEMKEFGIDWWLAPGMNIHRNPLCGRNFEYYSEDPLLSGWIAVAMVQGVQSYKGLGTTVKHFACNNQEDNRNHSDTIISERSLREIYLKGFEIVVREAQPLAIMTSFNLINGVHAANSYDLCTIVARQEWGFEGIIITDWFTTDDSGGSSSWKCIESGNDLIMPGTQRDIDNIMEALRCGRLRREDLEQSAYRVLANILKCKGKIGKND